MTMAKVPVPVTAAAIAGAEALSVANIDSPTELASLTGSVAGAKRLAYQAIAGANEWTLYAWDSSSSTTANSPYLVNGSAGQWVAIAGKYVNGASTHSGALTLTGSLTLTSVSSGLTIAKTTGTTLVVTSGTAATSTTSGCATFGGGIGVAGDSYMGGGVEYSRNTFAYADWKVPTGGSSTNRLRIRWSGALATFQDVDAATTFFTSASNALTLGSAAALSVPLTTASTSTTTGCATFGGGIGVAGQLSAATLLASGLTSGRVPIVSTGGLLSSDAGLTYASTVLTVGDGTNAPSVTASGPTTVTRDFRMATNGSNRWIFRATAETESGSNAGSNFQIRSRTDAGADQDACLTIVRAAGGAITLARPTAISPTSGTTLAVASTDASTTTTTGCATFAGGVGVAGAIFGRTLAASGSLDGQITITATNSSTGTSALGLFQAENNASVFGQVISFGSGNSSVAYGIARANWAQLQAVGASCNGLIIGTRLVDKPIVFGINDTEVGRFTSTGFDLKAACPLKVAGTQVVGAQGAAVADATDAASAITQLNALLARCRAHGLIAT